MIPKQAGVTNSGTIVGDSQGMGIDVSSIEHIMGVLTNLYRNAKRAFVREYSSNALDSHVDAGQTRPVEVSLPSAYDPQFEVRDYGTGLSTDELLRVYSQYGASTKRETDTQTGMLGLGSKSALAYAKQFTVISRRNGILTQALIFLNNRGAGEITIVDTRSTDEPDGTTIRIPVEVGDVRDVCEEAISVFSVWEPGTILVDGEEPTHLTDRLDGNVLVMDNAIAGYQDSNNYYGNRRHAYIVQGSVAYPVREDDFDFSEYLPKGMTAYIFVPIGTMQFVPSREDIYYTDQTTEKLREVFEAFRKDLRAHVTDVIADAETLWDAWIALNDFGGLLGNDEAIFWNNTELFRNAVWNLNGIDALYGTTRNRVGVDEEAVMSRWNLWGGYGKQNEAEPLYKLVITDYPEDSVKHNRWNGVNIPSTHKTRIRSYMGVPDNVAQADRWDRIASRNKRWIVLPGELSPLAAKLIAERDDIEVIDWDTLMNKTRAPKVKRAKGESVAGTKYHDREWETVAGYGENGRIIKRKIPADASVAFTFATEDTISGRAGELHWDLLPVDYIVRLTRNQEARFRREYPNAVTMDFLRSWVQDSSKAREAAGEWQALSDYEDATAYEWLNETIDPTLLAMFGKPAPTETSRFGSVMRKFGYARPSKPSKIEAYIRKNYPRILGYGMDISEKAEYVNAFYYYRNRKDA